jgi:exodeoxyribonuclease VII small subunit
VSKEEAEKMTFEEALRKLEIIVEKMEREDNLLEESLQSFEKGMELVRYCRKLLTEAEFKVEKILQNGELDEFKELGEI